MSETLTKSENNFTMGKSELLKWLNSTFKLDIKKIEHACTGAVYCQVIDAVHPGKVKMSKVNWKAKLEHEYLHNYKILQQAFIDCEIAKKFQVEKLIKGKYQDNLEFLQWLKLYYDKMNPIMYDYDPVKRRCGNDLEIGHDSNTLSTKARCNSKNPTSISMPKSFSPVIKPENRFQRLLDGNKVRFVQGQGNEGKNQNDYLQNQAELENNKLECNNNTLVGKQDPTPIEMQRETYPEEHLYNDAVELIKSKYQEKLDIANDDITKLKTEVNTLKMSLSEIAKEKDFYFSKLRDIEFLVTKNVNLDKEEYIKIIKQILYSEKDLEVIIDTERNVSLKF